MTFGSGVNGCLGHGNYDDVTKVRHDECYGVSLWCLV